MANQRIPDAFIYFDTEGIDSLFAQTVDYLEVERVQSKETNKEGKVGGKISLGQALGLLLGLGSAEVHAEGALGSKRTEEVMLKLSSEQKLFRLMSYLKAAEGESIFGSLERACSATYTTSRPVYLSVNDMFSLPQFFDGPETAIERVNAAKAVLFERGEPVDARTLEMVDAGTYQVTKDVRVTMQASIRKFPRVYGDEMSALGHDAMIFVHMNGRKVSLTLFGHVHCIHKVFFNIKPYAIWL